MTPRTPEALFTTVCRRFARFWQIGVSALPRCRGVPCLHTEPRQRELCAPHHPVIAMHIHAISIGFAGARALAARRTEPRPSVEKTKAATPTSASSARLARAPCLTSSRSSFAGGARLPVTALHVQTAPRVRSLVVRASGMGSQYGDVSLPPSSALFESFDFFPLMLRTR